MPSVGSRTKLKAALLVLAVASSMLGLSAHAAPATCSTTTSSGGDWPQIGNDLTGARHQEKEKFLEVTRVAQMAPAWVFDANRASNMANNEITGYPIIGNGCVYVGSSMGSQLTEGWVFAINADDGELVWRHKTDGGVYSSVVYDDGYVYAFVSRVGAPRVIKLDADTGEKIWQTTVDHQKGSDAVSSAVVFDGMVWVGVSGTSAEIDEGDRSSFTGNFVLLDTETGEILKKTWAIPEFDENGASNWERGFTGGAIWSTVSIDAETKYGYVGTGNPFDYENEYYTTNSILKLDLDKNRSTFGEIVDSYKGNVEEYFPTLADTVPCQELEEIGGLFALGLECLRLDVDFGAMPNIIEVNGRKLVSSGQKSGVVHTIDADTMEPVWTALLGVPSPVGGMVGSAAYDGRSLIGPHTIGSYLWSIPKEGGNPNWIAPVGSGVNWGPPVTIANGIAYTVELSGFLDAFDVGTGAPILRYPLLASPDSPGALVPVTDRPPLSWGAVSVARHTVYVTAGVGLTSAGQSSLPTGYVMAFRQRPAVTP